MDASPSVGVSKLTFVLPTVLMPQERGTIYVKLLFRSEYAEGISGTVNRRTVDPKGSSRYRHPALRLRGLPLEGFELRMKRDPPVFMA